MTECASLNSMETPLFRSSVGERVSCRGVCLFWRKTSAPPELCCTPGQREKQVGRETLYIRQILACYSAVVIFQGLQFPDTESLTVTATVAGQMSF